MLLVYAFLPLTRLVTAQGDRALLRYLLALWFLLGIVYPTVKPFWPFTLLRGIPTQWLMNMTYAAMGYTLLGYGLARYHSGQGRRWPLALCALAGAGTGFALSWMGSAAKGELYLHFLEGMGLPMCLLAVGIYGLCQGLRLPRWLERGVEYVSKASFCVFLTHIFFLKLLARSGITAQIGAPAWTVPLPSCCWAAAAGSMPFCAGYLWPEITWFKPPPRCPRTSGRFFLCGAGKPRRPLSLPGEYDMMQGNIREIRKNEPER